MNKSDREDLEIVDTDDKLTKEELKELKKLVALSKTTRAIFVLIMGIVAIFGVDRLYDILKQQF